MSIVAHLRESFFRWRITPMPLAEFFDLRKRVNVLKRIKADGKWKLCPAVIEPSGKLKDRVRVHGQIETHLEGSYFIEWREDGKHFGPTYIPFMKNVTMAIVKKSLTKSCLPSANCSLLAECRMLTAECCPG